MAAPSLAVNVIANAAQLIKTLDAVEPAIQATTAKMVSMTKAFNGDKILSDANAVVKAIDNIGGTSKLTDAEMAKVNATLDKAIQKYDALGHQAPPAMLALHQATEKVTEPLQRTDATLGKIWSGLQSAAGLIGVAFTAGAVINFAGKVFDAASAIHDQSIALDYSAEAYQRYTYAAEQSGASTESFVKAAGILNEKVGSGEKSTVGALKAVGKTLGEMRAMRPEDTWLELTKAVAAIEDPYRRAQVGQDLFGKGFKELLPGMLEGYDKLGSAATVMSNETVDRLEAAQDKWDTFFHNIVIWSAEAATAILTVPKAPLNWDQVEAAAYAEAMRRGISVTEEMAEVQRMSTKELAALVFRVNNVADVYDVKLSPAQEKYWAAVNKSIRPVNELSEEQRKAAAAAEQHAQQIQALTDVFTGKALAAKITDMASALKLAEKQGGLTATQSAALAKELEGLQRQGAVLTPELQRVRNTFDPLADAQKAAALATAAWRLEMRAASNDAAILAWHVQDLVEKQIALSAKIGTLNDLRNMGALGPDVSLGNAPGHGGTFADSLKNAGFVEQFAPTIMQAITGGGSVTQSVGALAGQKLGKSLSDEFGGTLKTALGPKIGGMLGSFLPGIGALVGPLIGKGLSALGGALGLGSAGRDMVKEFAQQAGGFDVLQKKLETLGDAGGQLWVKLTQGVGKNDKNAAKAAIEEVTKALGESEAALGRYGLTLDDLKPAADRAAAATSQLGRDLAQFTGMGADVASVAGKLKGPLNEALKQALDTGTKLPASMKPYIESLIRSGGLTDDLARRMLGLKTQVLPDWRAMEEAAERYGINVDALGAQFQQSKLNETIKQLTDDWALLNIPGADTNAILEKMAPNANEVLKNASKWGLELPASMKPFLEAMARAGLLTDDAGVKIEDLSTFKFSEDLTTKIDDLVVALGDLVEVLSNIPSPHITPIIDQPEIPNYGGQRNRGSGDGGSENYGDQQGYGDHQGYALGTPNLDYVNFGSGTRRMLHGDEAVVPRSGVSRFASDVAASMGGGSGVGQSVVYVQIDGRTMAEIVVPWVPGAVQRLRLT